VPPNIPRNEYKEEELRQDMARPELETTSIIKAISIILNFFLGLFLHVHFDIIATMEVFTLTYLFSNVVNLHCITSVLQFKTVKVICA
jgi:hypothetical protein